MANATKHTRTQNALNTRGDERDAYGMHGANETHASADNRENKLNENWQRERLEHVTHATTNH
eukprot:6790622-Lingulodinium_polyedra.AAC.1